METDILFRTRVNFQTLSSKFHVNDSFVFLGSCFSENMGNRFAQYGLPALSNPLGVLYNPASIACVVSHALKPDTEKLPLFENGNQWRCWWAGTSLSASTSEECKRKLTDVFATLQKALSVSTRLFITLGTPMVYKLKENGRVVANCHKVPAAQFEEYMLDVQECIAIMDGMIQELLQFNPKIQVHFTISPYRYAKYGFHGNQLAKAKLLLAVDQLCKIHPQCCSYLPVYEIFMDELRDYRFYAPDMLHPNDVAIDYIWYRIINDCMDDCLKHYISEYEPIRKVLQHTPSNPNSSQYHALLHKIEFKIQNLRDKYGLPACDVKPVLD